MSNYQKHNFGKLSELNQYVFAPEGTPINIPGKLFLKEPLGLTSMEISVNKDAPGTGMTFFHRHKNNQEIYVFIAGKAEMLIDDERFDVQEGSVVRVEPEAKRAWWNTGDEDLYYIVMQAPVGGLSGSSLEDGELLEGAVPWL